MDNTLVEFRGLTFALRVEDSEHEGYALVALSVDPPRPDGGDLYQGQIKLPRLQHNPEPLEVVQRRDNVTALAAIRGRSREDRLRVWLALGGTHEDFPDA